MLDSNSEGTQLPRVAQFYHGKSVFLTGGAGFVGSVLLETLLRCCPGIKSIYTLLRKKKDLQPEDRKESIFNKKIFEKIKKENPELLRKVRVISGDTSLSNLGMNEDDTQLLLEEVSIVFHCAADMNLKKPLEFSLKNNVLSLNSVIELCRKIRKFEVLIYTSTAYVNSNYHNFSMKEQVYRLPFHAGTFLEALKNDDKEKLRELIAHCKPDWPDSYSFSKCLAENLITDTASDLPVAIIRPSAVFSTWRHPIPGYFEENSGMATLSLGIGKGFLKVLNLDPNCKLNLVPSDIVANVHVLAAWNLGTKRYASPLVVNCTATESLQVEFREYTETMNKLVLEFPLPLSYNQPENLILVPNKYFYYTFAAFYHYLPAIVFDGMLRISGKKSRMYSLYHYIDKMMHSMHFYLTHSFQFERNNMELLDKFMHPEDRNDLTLDFRDATLVGMALSFPEGSAFYDWKIDRKSQWNRKKIMHRRHVQTNCIQGTFFMMCSLLIYCVFSFIFV